MPDAADIEESRYIGDGRGLLWEIIIVIGSVVCYNKYIKVTGGKERIRL